MKHRLAITCLFTVIFLSGCQGIVGMGEAKKSPYIPTAENWLPGRKDLSGLVDYAEWLNRQPPQSLFPVYRQALESERKSGKHHDKLILAMVLSMPGTEFQDDSKALVLLDSALDDTPQKPKGMRDFIRMQKISILSRRQLNQAWQQEVDLQKKRAETLQQQLNELKSIEKGLVDRLGELE